VRSEFSGEVNHKERPVEVKVVVIIDDLVESGGDRLGFLKGKGTGISTTLHFRIDVD
jgi:hypothetical protein